MKICHFSDWHGEFHDLPYADLYICTGDMLPNFPLFDSKGNRLIDKDYEKTMQMKWFDNIYYENGKNFRCHLGNHDAPVVVVRGNHDFTDMVYMFYDDVFEIDLCSYRFANINGLKIGGFRGINYIEGEWADEFQDYEFHDMIDQLPDDLDVIVTHTPPMGYFDEFFGTKLGNKEYSQYMLKLFYEENNKDRLLCFGHIHNQGGRFEIVENFHISNAATTFNMLEF